MMDLKELNRAISELEENKVVEILTEFVNTNPTEEAAQEVVNACQQGMGTVGELFEKGEYFVGDLIFAGELLTKAIDILRPALGGKSTAKVGTIVIATVSGDLHDIGKNIFIGMAEAAGFEVYDLGTDQPAKAFIEKAREVNADIIGMSGVLTLSIESMKTIVEELKQEGLREKIKVIIGGNPVTKEACDYVKADAFTTNAAIGVKICQGWIV